MANESDYTRNVPGLSEHYRAVLTAKGETLRVIRGYVPPTFTVNISGGWGTPFAAGIADRIPDGVPFADTIKKRYGSYRNKPSNTSFH